MQPTATLELQDNKYWHRALELVDQLPAFSPVLRRLLANLSTESDAVSFYELASVLEKDSLLTGKVLALVNSALYAPPVPVLSIPRALGILGTLRLRNLLLSFSLNRLFSLVQVPENWS